MKHTLIVQIKALTRELNNDPNNAALKHELRWKQIELNFK